MITGTSTNYTGRLVDLCLFPDISLPSTPRSMAVDSPARVIAGVSKAVQGFVMALLSREGENKEDPLMGTLFSERMGVNGLKYPSDIDQIFYIEASKAMDWWNSNSKSRPLDEQIRSVSLVGRVFGATSVSLSVRFVTLAGNDIEFLLPVKWSS